LSGNPRSQNDKPSDWYAGAVDHSKRVLGDLGVWLEVLPVSRVITGDTEALLLLNPIAKCIELFR
jgi:hypothetical protein